jgi:hypothetical protein
MINWQFDSNNLFRRRKVKLRSTSGLHTNLAFVLNRQSLADLEKEKRSKKKGKVDK